MTISLRNRPAGVAATAAALALSALAALATASPASASGPAPATALTPASASSAEPAAPTLPRPTGRYATGRDTLFLTDHTRTDPWVPAAGPRQLLVSLNYPARPGTGGDPAPYMTEEEARLMLAQRGLEGVPPELVSDTGTHARTAARPAPGRFPLVLLSPASARPGPR